MPYKNKTQVECCICREWQEGEDKHNWKYPSPHQRREYHFKGELW